MEEYAINLANLGSASGGTSSNTSTTQKVKESFTVSNDTTTSFTLSEIPIDTDMIFVFINGLLQDSPKDYTIVNKTLTFVNVVSQDDYIVVKYYKNTTTTTTTNTDTTTNTAFALIGTEIININVGDTYTEQGTSPAFETKTIRVNKYHRDLDAIKLLLDKAKATPSENVGFHVVGDSKRDGNLATDRINYTLAFSAFGVQFGHTAVSGITTDWWLNGNGGAVTAQLPKLAANLQTLGHADGTNQILEFSLGTNDLNVYITANPSSTDAERKAFTKAELIKGIDRLRADFPNAIVYLSISTGIENPILKEIYRELEIEKDMLLITGPLDFIYPSADQSKFFKDSHHPNFFGSRKILNNTLKILTKGDPNLPVDDYTPIFNTPTVPHGTDLTNGLSVENIIWIFDFGSFSNASYKSIVVPVEERTLIRITQTKGNPINGYLLGADKKGLLNGKSMLINNGSRLDPSKLVRADGTFTTEIYGYIPKGAKYFSLLMSMTGEDITVNDIKIETVDPATIADLVFPTDAEMLNNPTPPQTVVTDIDTSINAEYEITYTQGSENLIRKVIVQ